MRYKIRDIPAFIRTPIGRSELGVSIRLTAWPLYRLIAGAYRKHVLKRTRIVAVIGSLGKTTTVRALKAAFGLDIFKKPTSNAFSGLAESLIRVSPGSRIDALEIGIGQEGQMGPYAGMIRPDVVVVTSFASDHDSTFKDPEEKWNEKSLMVRALEQKGLLVLNGDDPDVLRMKSQTDARALTYGFGPDNDVRAEDPEYIGPEGMRFAVIAKGERREFQVRLIGRHMIYPILAATATALSEGFLFDDIARRLKDIPAFPQRLASVRLAGGAWLIRDEYKASVESMEASLGTLAAIPCQRRTAVLGEVSDIMKQGESVYRRLGERAAHSADRVIFVGNEKALESFRYGADEAGGAIEEIFYAGNNAFDAISLLPKALSSGDVILVNGIHHMRLDRVSLSLIGHTVRCRVRKCTSLMTRCSYCKMLERDWNAETAPV